MSERTTDHSEICRADMKNLFDQIMKHAPVDQKDPETVAADQLCKKNVPSLLSHKSVSRKEKQPSYKIP